MEQELDAIGQPMNEGLNWERRRDRGFDELVGLCRGVLADGALALQEAQFLLAWIRRNEPVQLTYLGQKLERALAAVLDDGRMDHDEEDMLVDLLMQATGGTLPETLDASYSTTLPLDHPVPEIVIAGKCFCFTGKFSFGTRTQCETAVVTRGGEVHKHPKSATCYLVVGEIGSRDWVHSTSGRKIEHAMLLKQDGKPVAIVAEQHWKAALNVVAAT
jgi:NAD-dependent DNA ligase